VVVHLTVMQQSRVRIRYDRLSVNRWVATVSRAGLGPGRQRRNILKIQKYRKNIETEEFLLRFTVNILI
jgi:hypothetical protein